MSELDQIKKIITSLGYSLNADQPHISGERFLMQAMTTASGQKFILLGGTVDQEPVVIKATKDKRGKNEINHERKCRSHINQLDFAYDIFAVPEEILHEEVNGYLINAQRYIPQEKSFLERPIIEQFDYTLRAFTAQESSRATTRQHLTHIGNIFGLINTDGYLRMFDTFIAVNHTNVDLIYTLKQVRDLLLKEANTITQYGGFLSHTDFVPHNFRINNEKLYLLDFSSIRFGNKHEGWARFLNFMSLHHPDLEIALIEYFKRNRAPEEYESLHLMRLFRLGEIITYYTKTLSRSEGNLLLLNTARIYFWQEVLQAELCHERVSSSVLINYQSLRDRLRSDDEKKRQQGLH